MLSLVYFECKSYLGYIRILYKPVLVARETKAYIIIFVGIKVFMSHLVVLDSCVQKRTIAENFLPTNLVSPNRINHGEEHHAIPAEKPWYPHDEYHSI